MKYLLRSNHAKRMLLVGVLFATWVSRPLLSHGQSKAEKEFIDTHPVPLNKANNMYALVNGWKTFNDKWGYTISFPKNITDGGTTASGIHYYDDGEISIEASCPIKATQLKNELIRWYNSTIIEINTAVYTVATRELTDNSFLIIRKYKDGGGAIYDKCIMGDDCLFKLSFSVDNANLKRLNEKDAEVILNLFEPTTVISKTQRKNK